VVAGSGMDLVVLQFKRRQIPHCKLAELAPARIDQKTLRDRAEKTPVAVLVTDPAGMVHVRGERPPRPCPRSAPVTGDHVSESIVLDADVWTAFQLCDDRIANRIFVKWRCRLLGECADDAQQ